MSFNNVSPGKDIPNDFNVIIEIPAQSDPVKYEADKETGLLHVDRFGNLITGARPEDLPPVPVFLAGGREIRGLSRTFADVAQGELLAYIGSSGLIEIGQREGNAAETLGLGPGSIVRICGSKGPC
jgi:S-adenosylmethionine hydrolase